jgi:hypothetical protein
MLHEPRICAVFRRALAQWALAGPSPHVVSTSAARVPVSPALAMRITKKLLERLWSKAMNITKVRRMLLALGFGIAAPLAVASMLAGTPANAQVKKGCSNVVAAKCPKNTERVCSQTDANGCCKKSSCVQKKK